MPDVEGAPMIPFVAPLEVDYGTVEQVSPLIQRVVASNPGPFTYTGTGTYIIGHDRPGASVAVIDPGPLDDRHLAALVQAVAGRRVSHILVTHTHRDHAPLARPFADRTGGRIMAAQPPVADTHAGGHLDEDDDADFRPDAILHGGERMSGDGWTLEALPTPGHASNHMAFALIEENALFCGDHVMGWSTTVVAPPDGNMIAYMASLDAVMARGFSTLWPTHGGPITDPAPFLIAYRDHRLGREQQIVASLVTGETRIADLVPVLYARVDERLWPAASLSVLAHLIKLVVEGRVACDGEPTMGSLYRLL